jgi:hypothetical protein
VTDRRLVTLWAALGFLELPWSQVERGSADNEPQQAFANHRDHLLRPGGLWSRPYSCAVGSAGTRALVRLNAGAVGCRARMRRRAQFSAPPMWASVGYGVAATPWRAVQIAATAAARTRQ